MNKKKIDITRGGLLAKNTMIFFIGQALPLVVALFAIPLIVNGLELERYALLSLTWVVVGYFGFFEFGIGRAVTKMLSENLGSGQVHDASSLIWTALLLTSLLGLVGALLLFGISNFLTKQVLNIPLHLQTECFNSLVVLSLSIPITGTIATLRGVLEANQRFGILSIVRVLMGSLMFLIPLLMLPFSQNIFYIVGMLVVARIAEWLLLFLVCIRLFPTLRHNITIKRLLVRRLIRFGGWVTVSNFLGPFMLYSDRFIIASMLSLAAATYFIVPSDLVIRLAIVPGVLAGVLFPALAATFNQDRKKTIQLFKNGLKYTFIFMFPFILILVAFTNEFLSIWMGNEFAKNSTIVMQLMLIGALINSHLYILHALLHASERPDLTAKMHIIELPIYLIVLFALTLQYGLIGSVVAGVLRLAAEALILLFIANRLLSLRSTIVRFIKFFTIAITSLFVFVFLPIGLPLKVAFLGTALILNFTLSWLMMFSLKEKRHLQNLLKSKIFY